jgi:Leucine-rich repeat (LRR) protein
MHFRFDRCAQNLDISDNDLVSLDKTSLKAIGVVSLVQLNASRNHISDIHEEAFLGQSKLQIVDLSSNSLIYIELKTFMRNPSLERLSLSNNQHLTLPEGDPFLDSKSLRVLQLSNCNLSHIPPKTFQYLPNLQELDISHNKIEILNPVQSVGHLTLLDVGHNHLTDLQSDIFTASPQLFHLNLSYNRLRILNVTVMPQLAKAINSTDLNGNPWVCDCVMFDTVYSWCRNNSVELGLVCSSPPKFKDKPWAIYEKAGCGDDDDSDFADAVEKMTNVTDKLSLRSQKYVDRTLSDSLPIRIQEQPRTSNINYLHICIALFVALLCLLTLAGVLLYRYSSRTFRRTGPAQSDAETCRLSGIAT